jgi:hypothetical protein
MEQKIQDLSTMQKTILHKRSQRQQNLLRQMQTKQQKRIRSQNILKQTQMEKRTTMTTYKPRHKLQTNTSIQTDLRFKGSLKPEIKISNQQIEDWLNS